MRAALLLLFLLLSFPGWTQSAEPVVKIEAKLIPVAGSNGRDTYTSVLKGQCLVMNPNEKSIKNVRIQLYAENKDGFRIKFPVQVFRRIKSGKTITAYFREDPVPRAVCMNGMKLRAVISWRDPKRKTVEKEFPGPLVTHKKTPAFRPD